MIEGILGGVAGIAGGIFGGMSASKAMKKVRSSLQEQKRTNQDWYDQRYNEDATQRADAQAILARTEAAIKSRNRAASGAAAVMGGTEESVAATKAANSQALADATATIAINGDRRKDSIEAQYQAKEEALQSQLNDLERQKAGNVAQAAMGVAQAGANIAGIL